GGMPWQPGVSITPLPEHGKPETLAAMVADAVSKGARVVNRDGGAVHGTWMKPAVVSGVKPGMQLHELEQFGPVVPIATWRDEREVDEQMKASPYGQQMSIFGKDPQRIARFIDAHVNGVSRINVNTQCRRGPDTFPFTGRKDSAEGTLSVSDALRAFSIRCVVATSADPANTGLVTEIVTRRLSTFLSTDYVF
ncbi:MAG TPA: aldehyde dehydrogenase family protein, partial [Actinomycetota bacterium]|nr:aldehyde dehydrogenase family protein [Actinomycetota bacterium]